MHRCVRAIVAAVIALAFPFLLTAQNAGEHGFPVEKDRPIEVPHSTRESAQDIGMRARTNHLIVTRPEKLLPDKKQALGSRIPVGETPGSLACVYKTASPLVSGCPITGKITSGNHNLPNNTGGSQTIALVDAYHYPTAFNDINAFSTQFGLPTLQPCSPTLTTGCFGQVYAAGTQPATDGSWALEAALDIEWAHAMAPNATIVLVEANSDSYADLFQAVSVASSIVTQNNGFGEVSMSWGGSEFSGETTYDSYFQTPNVVYFAAAGDSGGQTLYPSVSPYVVSAGGTTVNRNSSGNFVSETAWSSGGGGASFYEPRPAYQNPVENKVGTKRGTPDFSFDANPNTGVFVYDTTPYDGSSGWWIVGGTSVATPSLAGIINLAGSFNSDSFNELVEVYSICPSNGPSTKCLKSSEFRDITSGHAGSHSAATGWDFATGLGSNQGLNGK
ncbi:MAG: S53 family peptidase [Candidatus Korobacteraceae bacterium]